MSSIRNWAQAIYLRQFSKAVSSRLRRSPRVNYESTTDNSIRVIARYQRSGGITNGALHNMSAFRAAGYSVEPIDVSGAIRNPFQHVACAPGGVWIFSL